MKHLRVVLLLGLLGLGLAAVAWQRGWIDPVRPLRQAAPTEPTVLFVVLDTVRADRLGVCGYHRPNTPNLQRLVDAGASLTCRAYAPGSWTLPSHASYFTGLDVPEHGAHSMPDGVSIGRVSSQVVRPLGDEAKTLAEKMVERGFQAHMVSGNPVLAEASGLQRGFASARVATAFGQYYGNDLLEAVRETLRWDVELDRPLFLFVNIADVHQPWSDIPPGLDWVGVRAPLRYETTDPDGEWVRFMEGRMPEDEQATFLPHLGDVYDYAVYRADATFGALLEVLGEFGWDAAGIRIVLTSDHGEHLGENGLIDHGASVLEPNQRVPILVTDAALPTGPVNASIVHQLVQTHRAPSPLPPVRSASYPQPIRRDWAGGKAFQHTQAARWEGTKKWLWQRGEGTRSTDLARCPDETPGCWVAIEAVPVGFDGFLEAVRRSGDEAVDVDADLMQALEAAGYVE